MPQCPTPSLLHLNQKHRVVSEKLFSSEIGIRAMLPDQCLWGAGMLRLPEQGSCWVRWVKRPARGLHLAALGRFTSGQGSPEGHFTSTRLIKGLFQLPGSDVVGKKALAWGRPWESLLQPPAATPGKGCSFPLYLSLHPLKN